MVFQKRRRRLNKGLNTKLLKLLVACLTLRVKYTDCMVAKGQKEEALK